MAKDTVEYGVPVQKSAHAMFNSKEAAIGRR